MAELVDALASGASVPRDVEVQVLSSVPEDISIAFTRLAKGSFQIGESLFSLSTVRFKNNIRAILIVRHNVRIELSYNLTKEYGIIV